MEPMLITRDGALGAGRRLQQRQEELGGVEDSLDIEVEDPVPRGGVVLGQRGAPGSTGIVDQHVDLPVLDRHLVGEAPGAFFGGEVGNQARARAESAEFGHFGLDCIGLT